MSKEKTKRRIRQATAAALLLAVSFTFPSGMKIMGVSFGNAIVASAETAEGDFQYSVSGDSVTITGYSGSGGAVVIPSEIEGKPVSSIGEWAFYSCASLTSITIPSSVTSIGEGAFYGCTSLSSITVDENNPIYSSENGVLFNKNKTILIQYPQNKSEASYSIPDSVTSIGSDAFAQCSNLTNVTFGENTSLEAIEIGAFASCTSLSSMAIPDSVTSIVEGAFEGCTSLSSVTFGENPSLDTIEAYVFEDCTSLSTIAIPDSVANIGTEAFKGCEKLKSITFGDNPSVTSIESNAFEGCSSLESIVIPDSTSSISIGERAFYGCTGLESIVISDSTSSIGTSAFQGCTKLTSVTFGENSSLSSISSSTFFDCTSLASITIPSKVKSIGDHAFSGCTSLASVEIQNGVTSIGLCAFNGCTSLAGIAIPDSVESINYKAFNGCTSLASVTFGNSPKLRSIGNEAFSGCTSLASITIPRSVNFFGVGAFDGCTILNSIVLYISHNVSYADIVPQTATQVRYDFSGKFANITEITLGTGQTSVDIPETICGKAVIAIAEDCLPMISSHTHYFGDSNSCSICGFVRPTMNESGYYEITNADQLFWFADKVNTDNAAYGSANAVLTADIAVNEGDVAGCNGKKAEGWKDWTPIGWKDESNNKSYSYTGTFDGAGKTISGLYFNDTNTSYVGLFGVIGENGNVSNVGVENSYFNGELFVGSICGVNYGKITSCHNTGAVSGTDSVGGICGANVGTIANCYNTGTVSSDGTSGGVCGSNSSNSATITNCYNTGAVSGTLIGGGVCGDNAGTIKNCYNTGAVSSDDTIGGISGGVCGINWDENEIATITNCYFDSTVYNGEAVGYDLGAVTDVLGKTTDEFKSGEVAYLLQNGQTADENGKIPEVWGQDLTTKTNYPALGGVKVYRNATYKGCEGKPGDPNYSYSNAEAEPVYAEHKLSPIEEKPASCTEDGYEAHFKCDICGKLFEDENGKTEVTLEDVKIAAHHTKDEGTVNKESLTENSITVSYKCSACGKDLGEENVSVKITNVEVTSSKVIVSFIITETEMTEEYALDEVTEAIVGIMKPKSIQHVIDYVNSFTADDTDDILTDAQLKAIEEVLAHDFGVAA